MPSTPARIATTDAALTLVTTGTILDTTDPSSGRRGSPVFPLASTHAPAPVATHAPQAPLDGRGVAPRGGRARHRAARPEQERRRRLPDRAARPGAARRRHETAPRPRRPPGDRQAARPLHPRRGRAKE